MVKSCLYRRGFVILDSGRPGPGFITPHSGFSIPHRIGKRDSGTENVSYYSVLNGGIAIIASIGRDRVNGIDFYRLPPTEKEALHFYKYFVEDDKENIKIIEKNYAWVARNKKEHDEKEEIYNDFWKTVKDIESPFFIIIHTQLPRIKNYPSIMDIATFEGKSFDNTVLLKAVESINEKYKDVFKKILPEFNRYTVENTKMYIGRIKEKFNGFNLNCITGASSVNLEKDIEMINKFAKPEVFEIMNNRLNSETYLLGVQNAVNNVNEIKITVEENFKGKLAMDVVLPLLKEKDGIAIQVECSHFLSKKRPKLAQKLIWDIVNECKEILNK